MATLDEIKAKAGQTAPGRFATKVDAATGKVNRATQRLRNRPPATPRAPLSPSLSPGQFVRPLATATTRVPIVGETIPPLLRGGGEAAARLVGRVTDEQERPFTSRIGFRDIVSGEPLQAGSDRAKELIRPGGRNFAEPIITQRRPANEAEVLAGGVNREIADTLAGQRDINVAGRQIPTTIMGAVGQALPADVRSEITQRLRGVPQNQVQIPETPAATTPPANEPEGSFEVAPRAPVPQTINESSPQNPVLATSGSGAPGDSGFASINLEPPRQPDDLSQGPFPPQARDPNASLTDRASFARRQQQLASNVRGASVAEAGFEERRAALVARGVPPGIAAEQAFEATTGTPLAGESPEANRRIVGFGGQQLGAETARDVNTRALQRQGLDVNGRPLSAAESTRLTRQRVLESINDPRTGGRARQRLLRGLGVLDTARLGEEGTSARAREEQGRLDRRAGLDAETRLRTSREQAQSRRESAQLRAEATTESARIRAGAGRGGRVRARTLGQAFESLRAGKGGDTVISAAIQGAGSAQDLGAVETGLTRQLTAIANRDRLIGQQTPITSLKDVRVDADGDIVLPDGRVLEVTGGALNPFRTRDPGAAEAATLVRQFKEAQARLGLAPRRAEGEGT